jgi:hypothetical protein
MDIPIGLELRVVDVDADYVMVEFSAADGRFAGSTALYGGGEEVDALARGFGGFPRHPDERRDITLGSPDPQIADGWVRIACRCEDRSGHVLLEIYVLDKAVRASVPGREVRIHLPVEPAALDRFATALRDLEWRAGASATLLRTV